MAVTSLGYRLTAATMLALQQFWPYNIAGHTTMLALQQCRQHNNAGPTTMLALQQCWPYNNAGHTTVLALQLRMSRFNSIPIVAEKENTEREYLLRT